MTSSPAHARGKRLKGAAAAILGGLLALSATVLPAAAQTAGRSPDLAEVARLVIDRTNELRRAGGLEPVGPEARLNAAARDFAVFMGRTDRYGHEADGRTPAGRAGEQGYAYCVILENIASVYRSAGFSAQDLADRVIRGWEQSEGHRRNLLDVDVTDIGVAVAQSEKSRTYYAVQMFGRPRGKQIEFRVANASPAAVEYELNGRAYSLPPRATRVHQECRAARLSVHLPGDRQTTTVQPADGDRYQVERLGSRYQLKKGAS